MSDGSAIGRGRAAWPGIDVPDAAFARWLEARARETAIDVLHVEDLYLACACALGNPRALRAFDQAFAGEFATLHRRFPWLPEGHDDVRQIVHARLFVGEHPKIHDYSGRGELRTWLRVAIMRLLLNAKERETRELPIGEELFRSLPEPATPEVLHFRETYREAIHAAFVEAVASLDERSQSVLRYALVEKLGIDALGKIYGVHRATAARWVTDAKDLLGERMRSMLRSRLGVSQTELMSIVAALKSHLDLSLAQLLR